MANVVLAAVLLSLAASGGGGDHRHDVRVAGLYLTRSYGFSLIIPKAYAGWRTAAPAPDHGVEVDLGPGRSLTVSAEFNAVGYPSLDALLDGELDTGRRAKPIRTTLGGRPALRGEVSKGRSREIVVVRQDGRDVDGINFIADLNTTAADERADERVLEEVLATFHRVPR